MTKLPAAAGVFPRTSSFGLAFRGFPPHPLVLRASEGNRMAELIGNLWELNLARIVVVDVTEDYRLMQPPMPSDFYPVLTETWLPRYKLEESLMNVDLVNGYLYDWHETPETGAGHWYVGVVQADLARAAR